MCAFQFLAQRSTPVRRARAKFIPPTVLAICFLAAGCGPAAPDASESNRLSEIGAPLRDDPDGAHDEARPPSYDESELAALAASEQVKAWNAPFADAPAPTESRYVTVSDGTRLALSLYFPPRFVGSSERAPVVYIETWYGRSLEATGTAIRLYNDAGIVVAIGDPRGFGASFGAQPGLMDDNVRRDQREIVAWLSSQVWSNGRVATAGFSISGTDADLIAASGAPSLGAAVVRAADFDHYTGNLFPGGIPNLAGIAFTQFLFGWMRGDLCADLATCGIAPVDGDVDLSLLASAFQEHRANVAPETFASVVYRDDRAGSGTFDQVSAVGSVESLKQTRIPARVSGSWLDGTTADSALARFTALPDVPMQVVIGATTHSGGLDADPFSRVPFREAEPGAPAQYADDVAFVRKVLAGQRVGRSVQYYVLGAGSWKHTRTWPPAGVERRTLALSRSGLETHGHVLAGEATYHVDETASSGRFNRWASQHGSPIFYGDRRQARGLRISFDAAPVAHDMELVGSPELCLSLRSDQPDGIVIAYLEDVAPNGRVTYLTEGELRLIHRNTALGGCDPESGTTRSFNRSDAAPVIPGASMRIELPFLATAALIRRGHHLRLSLAGADQGGATAGQPGETATFPPLTEVPATWSIGYGGRAGSTLTLPLRPWSKHTNEGATR